jgi:type II secretory pathway component PulF
LILGLGGIVGLIVISLFLPLVSLIQQIGTGKGIPGGM